MARSAATASRAVPVGPPTPAPLPHLVRRLVGRGASHLVLLPLTLDDAGLSGTRLDVGSRLRVHRGRGPATDDIARLLGDRARDAARALIAGRRQPAQLAAVIAARGGANPASTPQVAPPSPLPHQAPPVPPPTRPSP